MINKEGREVLPLDIAAEWNDVQVCIIYLTGIYNAIGDTEYWGMPDLDKEDWKGDFHAILQDVKQLETVEEQMKVLQIMREKLNIQE